jgi:DNA replication protein DnaC
MKTVAELTTNVLTATQAPPTKEPPVNTKDWAKWLRLETFGEPGLESLVERCALFASALAQGERPRWLSILGKSGTGKSHCAERLWSLRQRLDWSLTRYTGRLVYWPQFVEELRESVREGTGMANLLDMGSWPLLVIDDIGAERDQTGFASEKLNMLLGMRVGKWTVITSNLLLKALSKVDDRIASLMFRERGNLVIEIQATKDFGERK